MARKPENKNTANTEAFNAVDDAKQAKLYARGAKSNGAGLFILVAIAYSLNIQTYTLVALGMQYAVFVLHALPHCSERFYDLSGSFTHLAVVLTSLCSARRARSPRQLLVAVASVVWMTRLGTFLYNRILKDGKDERFDNIKPVWLSFLGAWTIQAVWVILIQLPVVLLNIQDDIMPTTMIDMIGMAAWLLGFVIEAAADSEKMQFRSDPANKERYITTGLWSLSRHPNYFGEILMWSSMALISSNAATQLGATSLHAGWISPLFTAVLLLKVSGVPMVEKAGEKKWGKDPVYQNYMSNTSCIVPWFPAQAPGIFAKEAAVSKKQ